MTLVQTIFSPDVAAALLAAVGPVALIHAPTRRLRALLAQLEQAPARGADPVCLAADGRDGAADLVPAGTAAAAASRN